MMRPARRLADMLVGKVDTEEKERDEHEDGADCWGMGQVKM